MVLEYAQVKLREGVSKEDFIKQAVKIHNEFLMKQPGCQRHNSWWAKTGEWVDTVVWESMAAAEAASTKLMESNECNIWLAMMDDSSIVMKHFEEAVQY